MTQRYLCVARDEMSDFARLLRSCGVVSIGYSSWDGFSAIYTEGREEDGARALALLRERLQQLPACGRRNFIDGIQEQLKEKK